MIKKQNTFRSVNRFLCNLALSPSEKFNPYTIVEYDKELLLSDVVKYLLKLKDEGIVVLKHEKKSNGDIIDFYVKDFDKANLSEFYPVFYLSEEYKIFIREKHMNLLK